jgi:hypothetical protein
MATLNGSPVCFDFIGFGERLWNFPAADAVLHRRIHEPQPPECVAL